MNPHPIRESAVKIIIAMARIRMKPQPRKNSPNDPDITEIALKKS